MWSNIYEMFDMEAKEMQITWSNYSEVKTFSYLAWKILLLSNHNI